MTELLMTVFNVERGLCVFVQSPVGYGILIDCGKSSGFSPIRWICDKIASRLTPWNGRSLTYLIVSHPHDDHVEDIGRVLSALPPAILIRQSAFEWGPILRPQGRESSPNVQKYYEWQKAYCTNVTYAPTLGLGMEMWCFALTPWEAINCSSSVQSYVNNTSYVTVLRYAGRKIVIAGDNETSGWNKLIEKQAFRTAVAGVDFFVTSHHGHLSGFSPELFQVMGKPLLNITSERSGDANVATAYSLEEYARGMSFHRSKRYHLTTRKDGSILVRVTDTGQCYVESVQFPDNLDRLVL